MLQMAQSVTQSMFQQSPLAAGLSDPSTRPAIQAELTNLCVCLLSLRLGWVIDSLSLHSISWLWLCLQRVLSA